MPRPNARLCQRVRLQGRRLVRVHNLALIASADLSDVFRVADLDAVFAAKVQAKCSGLGVIPRLLAAEPSWPLGAAREALVEHCADALHAYRTQCAQTSPAGQLILPESLKLLPLYSLGALKSLALRENVKLGKSSCLAPDPRADERSFRLQGLDSCSPAALHRLLQPRLFDVACLDPTSPAGEAAAPEDTTKAAPGEPLKGPSGAPTGTHFPHGHVALPPVLPCSAASLEQDKVLLLDAGAELFLWVGSEVDGLILEDLFGVDEVSDACPPDGLADCAGGSLTLGRLVALLAELRLGLPGFAPLKVVVSGPRSAHEPRFHSLLIEDKTSHEMSYVDFLCAIHRKIQQKMSKA